MLCYSPRQHISSSPIIQYQTDNIIMMAYCMELCALGNQFVNIVSVGQVST